MALHIYGVATADDVAGISLRGLQRKSVRVVDDDGLAALVSEVPDDLQVGRADLLAHARVLERLAGRITVVPMQFGMVVSDLKAVREGVLQSNYVALSELLRRLDGAVQLTVKAYHHEEPALLEVMHRFPAIRDLRDQIAGLPAEAAYYQQIGLGEAIYGCLERLRDIDAGAILERLEPVSVDVRATHVSGVNQVLNAAFLVRRDRRAAFDRSVTDVRNDLAERLQLRYIGPQPPYSFVDAMQVS